MLLLTSAIKIPISIRVKHQEYIPNFLIVNRFPLIQSEVISLMNLKVGLTLQKSK